LRQIRFSGRTEIVSLLFVPGFAGTPARPPGAGLCFWV
jgi:hypothetical protein